MAGTLRSWIHYIDVRAEEGTQKEHREVALAARDEILGHFPSLNEYWFPKVEIRDYTGTKKRCEHCFAPIETKPWWKFWS
jgi:thymidylate synthase ThyX